MPPRRCCCTGCLIASDTFNRTASTLGSSWTHDPGDWITVATGPWRDGYAESQIDGAVAIHNTSHPLPDESGVVFLDICDEVHESGDKYRGIVNAIDIDNYHFAEYIRNGYGDSILRLGICVAGADTILESKVITGLSDPINEPRRMAVMIADNEFCASVSHTVYSFVFYDTSPTASGYKAGFGGDLGTRFCYWEFQQHAQTLSICPHCLCKCETDYIPPVLNAHLEGTGRMATLSCDITLEWDRINGNWYGTLTCCNQFWELQLDCPFAGGTPAFDVHTAKLTVLTGCIDSDGIDTGIYYITNGQRYANETSTCEPLSLVFGVFNVSNLDLACGCPTAGPAASSGTYTITITEAP